MAAIGGSIESVSLDGRNFAVAADAEASRKLGGYENEVERNGDGTARLIKTATAWSLDGLAIQIDDSSGDAEFVQALANRNGFWPAVISYVSGISYTGQGQLTGDVAHASKATTMAINLMGTGELTQT